MFDNLRTTSRREPIPDYQKRGFQKPKDEGPRMENNRKPPYPKKYEKSKPERNADERPPIRCFGCNEPGVIRAKCPRCSPQGTNETARFGNIQLHSCTDESPQVAVLRARVNGIFGTVCADTGASHSIAGEQLYKLMQEGGADFKSKTLKMSLADGQKMAREVRTTCVTVELGGRKFPVTLIALPDASNNRTLLGADFLKQSGVVLNMKE
ncbi:hypothetical protein JTE90_007979 [Oedothorax gibbosus]|uniref:Peptidase A2 domain-containing protein n=1 Tax=Oedothorax gibbosus TaxID=931172 RepID=A0AAV6TTB0_9ARAC|nr:hypothetical protein JTE90_007979 [Oedothorax gibbosus]